MNNSNNNNNNRASSSPLDELKKLNEKIVDEASARRSAGQNADQTVRRPVAQPPVRPKRPVPVMPPQQNAAAPAAPVPVRAPQQNAAAPGNAAPIARPAAAGNVQQSRVPPKPRISQTVDGEELIKIVPSGREENGLTRAEKVRLARASSLSANRGRPEEINPALTRVTSSVPVPASAPAGQAQAKSGRRGSKRTVSRENGSGYDEEFKETIGRGVISNTVKAVIYIVCVLVISGCLSLFAIFVGNDAFAFVKDDTEITVTIPQGATLSDIAKILGDNDVIKYPSMFKMYVNLRKKGADEYLYGSFTVSPSMPYDTLIATFKKSAQKRQEITITFTEGMTVDDMIDTFLENGIGTRERFIDVIQNYDFDYWFVDELDKMIAENPNSGRKYRLEGYLFPDTYNFYTDSTEESAVNKLLANFDVKFDDTYRLAAADMGYTCDQVITLASMIQKEAKFISDYGATSSVFHNRLKTNVTGKLLQSNATVQYTMPKEEVRLELTYNEILKYDNPYNTYLYAGLPVGPISNPSLNAIYWTLYPIKTDYYYFISDAQGYNLYARTSAEHEANRAKVAAAAAAAAASSESNNG